MARAVKGSKVTSNLLAAATYSGTNLVTGLKDYNVKAMQQWLALDGRGLFGKKFELDITKSLHEQVKQVKAACADGYIGTQEMTAFIDAICKEVSVIDYLNLHERLSKLEQQKDESNA